jgi:hypothetical protein
MRPSFVHNSEFDDTDKLVLILLPNENAISVRSDQATVSFEIEGVDVIAGEIKNVDEESFLFVLDGSQHPQNVFENKHPRDVIEIS